MQVWRMCGLSCVIVTACATRWLISALTCRPTSCLRSWRQHGTSSCVSYRLLLQQLPLMCFCVQVAHLSRCCSSGTSTCREQVQALALPTIFGRYCKLYFSCCSCFTGVDPVRVTITLTSIFQLEHASTAIQFGICCIQDPFSSSGQGFGTSNGNTQIYRQ